LSFPPEKKILFTKFAALTTTTSNNYNYHQHQHSHNDYTPLTATFQNDPRKPAPDCQTFWVLLAR